jgi:pyrroloquinoline-quinone synthase
MLRSELDDLFEQTLDDRRLLEHPFYRRWEAGELVPAELAAYAGQYRHFEQALPTALAQVIGALPEGRARSLVQANLDDERGKPMPHLELFDEFAGALGAPLHAPATDATAALVARYGKPSADPVAVLAAVAAYEIQAPGIATSKAEGLRTRYGLSSGQTRFWDVHSAMDEDHAAWVLDALAELDADHETVAGAARAAADAWWAFLDERQEAAPQLAAAG